MRFSLFAFFAPEGYPYFAGFGIVTLIFGVEWGWLAIIPGLLLAFMFYFFRDPERETPREEGYICPADGRIIVAENLYEDNYLKKDSMLISIFMSPMDVHVNRAPCDCTVRLVKYTKGSFKKAFTEHAFHKNEHISVVMEEEGGGNLLVRQVAGSIAQKAVCRKKPGDRLKRGERFGMIKFSSRVDVYLPPDVKLQIALGDRVRAGETILAKKA
ncbi:MAG: phosphatidylserine decarboxylase family protein [Nitrospiraceae bacterium]|nr:phosphatidylserine decarboxylase family protein [Nitrospiraceae bacterium]